MPVDWVLTANQNPNITECTLISDSFLYITKKKPRNYFCISVGGGCRLK